MTPELATYHIFAVLVLILVVSLVAGSIAYREGKAEGNKEGQRAAVKAHLAEYRPNHLGEPQFFFYTYDELLPIMKAYEDLKRLEEEQQ